MGCLNDNLLFEEKLTFLQPCRIISQKLKGLSKVAFCMGNYFQGCLYIDLSRRGQQKEFEYLKLWIKTKPLKQLYFFHIELFYVCARLTKVLSILLKSQYFCSGCFFFLELTFFAILVQSQLFVCLWPSVSRVNCSIFSFLSPQLPYHTWSIHNCLSCSASRSKRAISHFTF